MYMRLLLVARFYCEGSNAPAGRAVVVLATTMIGIGTLNRTKS
jgi:hypothetical protein